MKRILLLFVFILQLTSLYSQIERTRYYESEQRAMQRTVNNTITPDSLVKVLIGKGIEFSNVELNCHLNSYTIIDSCFHNPNKKGILLSTGSVDYSDLFFYDDCEGDGHGWDTQGDDDLNAILGEDITYDACVLEFDFVPQSTQISFSYSFMSKEYPEYVCSQYNDIFAFFISGPGIIGLQNMALIPGTELPVSINSINNGGIGTEYSLGNCISLDNSDLYIDNCDGHIQANYDGFTTALTAQASVIPCQIYRIKLAIADVADAVYSSTVNIEGSSFNNNFDIQVEDSLLIYGCSEQTNINFIIPNPAPDTLIFTVGYSGKASMGIDYDTLPSTIVFLPGDTLVSIPLQILDDNIHEIVEEIKIEVTSGCETLPFFTKVIYIHDKELYAYSDVLGCTEDIIELGVLNYSPENTYHWIGPNGFTSDTSHVVIPNANSSHNGVYILSSYSPNCGTMYDTVQVNLASNSIRFLGSDTVLCSGETKVLDATVAGATYLWKGGDTTSSIVVDTSGTYWVAVTKNGCVRYDTIQVTFIENPALDSIPYKTRHNCIEDDSGVLQLLWGQKTGGEIIDSNDLTTVTYIKSLNYELRRDSLYNGTYDDQCYDIVGFGTLQAEFRDSLFIKNLRPGDYQIILQPKTICRKVSDENGVTTDSVCVAYTQCYQDSIIFTFSVNKYEYPKLLEDRILCPGGMVSLSVPGHYYDQLPPESIKWGSICGIYDSEYDFSKKEDSVLISEDTIRNFLINGRGGVHTVEIVTQDGCTIRDSAIVADLKPQIILDSMPSALTTTAVNYSGAWSAQYNSIRWEDSEVLEDFVHGNIYATGESGIYRPHKNHDYLDSLNTSIGLMKSYESATPSTDLRDIDIRASGNIMPYFLFNYGNPLFVHCVPQWVHNSTMTRYSPSGFDIENRDIMDIYNSALYGYNNMLPIAVAANARNDEIGYEGFEEYSLDASAFNYYDSLTQLNNSTGNIDLVRQTESLFMPKITEYEIVRAFNRYAMIKGNISNACDDFFYAQVVAQTVPKDIREESIEEKTFQSYQTRILASPCGDSSYTIVQLGEGLICQEYDKLKCRFWVGRLDVIDSVFVPMIENINFRLDTTRAHTGKYSLRIPSNEKVFLPQTSLFLKPKQTYHFGAWVHSSGMDALSPRSLKNKQVLDSIGVLIKLPNHEEIWLQPSGEVIDGWQKIEGTFTMPSGVRTQIQLGFHAAEEFNIDDIRIYPQNSAIQTYVYDPNNYKVRAILDHNNYATIYLYDDEGNLFAIKKETIQGIKTIQISSSHLKSERQD